MLTIWFFVIQITWERSSCREDLPSLLRLEILWLRRYVCCCTSCAYYSVSLQKELLRKKQLFFQN